MEVMRCLKNSSRTNTNRPRRFAWKISAGQDGRVGEIFKQYASRLTSMFELYCKLRGPNDFDNLKQLINSDKLIETLDSETSIHIRIKQERDWYKPRELAQACYVFFAAKGKSYEIHRNGASKNHFEKKKREFREELRKGGNCGIDRNLNKKDLEC